MEKKLTVLVTVILIAVLFIALSQRVLHYEQTDFAMDTVITIRATGINVKDGIEKAMAEIKRLDNQLSAYREGSELWNTNHGFDYWGNHDTIRCIERGIYFGKLSDGVFDISIKPLADLWKDNKNPSFEQIDAAKKLVDYKLVAPNTVLPAGMSLDLGGIAKGYAAAEAEAILRKNGVTSAIISCGGNIVVIGKKPQNVGIQDPLSTDGNVSMGFVTVADKSVVTSGNYHRGDHIIDPRLGYPVNNGIVSATVICENSMDADALSTILFIMGENGLDFIKKQNAEGIIINSRGEVRTTGIDIEITNNNFVRR